MHQKKKNRLILIFILMVFCSLGVYLILSNLNDNIVFFHPPSEISKIQNNNKVRIGGLVKVDSIKRLSAQEICFILTDNLAEIEVSYSGILPGLFREKQGIVAEGFLSGDRKLFKAKKLLAKHDENYMPPEIKSALDKQTK